MISWHAMASARKPSVFETALWRPINPVQHRVLLSILFVLAGRRGLSRALEGIQGPIVESEALS